VRLGIKEKSGLRLAKRFSLTTIDQCVASLSNFAVGAAIAHIAGLAAFGAYSLVYSAWCLVAAFHRSLVTDPMAIENEVHQPDAAKRIRLGLAADLWLGLAMAGVFAMIGTALIATGHRQFGVCFVGIAPALPFLLAQDYWRRVGFMRALPQKALANDIVFDVFQVATFAGLFAAGMRSPLLAIISWGVGAASGAIYGLHQFSSRPSLAGGIGRIKLHWGLSRWLVATNIISSATAQATVMLSGAILGPVGVAGLKAPINLVGGPSMVLINAGGSIGLPESSRALAEKGWPGLRRVQRLVGAAAMVNVGIIAIVVIVFGRRLLELLYGPAFGRFAGVADIVAIAIFISTAGIGPILSLKATKQTHRFVPLFAGSLIVSIISVVVLAELFGLVGAAFSVLISNTLRTVGLMVTHWKTSRKAAERMADGRADELNTKLDAATSGSEGQREVVPAAAPASSAPSSPHGWRLSSRERPATGQLL
jgi:O-antigen/teichoic acid export membrane protein